MLGARETAEDEIDVADLLTERIIAGTEAEAAELVGFEVLEDGFEAIVGAGGAMFAVAQGAERQFEIIAKDENLRRLELIEMGESRDGETGIVVESLRFDEDGIAGFAPESVEFGLLPVELVNFGIKIERQEAEVMAGEVVF